MARPWYRAVNQAAIGRAPSIMSWPFTAAAIARFFTLPDHVKLDTGTHCGPLNGDLEVDSVAGISPVA